MSEIFSNIDPQMMALLDSFLEELRKWNKSINLISKGSEKDARIIHLLDGVLGVRAVMADAKDTQEIFDLGSGNGIPGIVFAIMNPGIKTWCVESDQRKCAFMKATGYKLGIKNLGVLNQRVESIAINKSYTLIARGFAPLNAACELVEKFSLTGSSFYHFKSTDWRSELGEKCSTWNISPLSTYNLPVGDKPTREIVKAVKI